VQECSDGDKDGMPGSGERCVDGCKRYFNRVPVTCEDLLDEYLQCLMINRGFFEVHCDGDTLVREDTASCADIFTNTQACIDVNQQ